MSSSNETLPLPTQPTGGAGGSTDTILAQFYRVAPLSVNNINIPIINAATKVFLPIGAFNNTQGPPDVTFPDNNSIQIAKAGTYLHNITIYMFSDVPGILGVDLVDGSNTQYSNAAFIIKDSAPSTTEPTILTASIDHTAGQIVKLRFGGASAGDLGITPSIWSIQWSVKS